MCNQLSIQIVTIYFEIVGIPIIQIVTIQIEG